ncbi:mucin-binding protein, partial [Secundilactobacillus folii]
TVHFVDEAGETLAPDIEVTGVTNGTVDRTAVRNQIQQIINQQYNLVSDGTGTVFNNVDNDNQDFEVVFAKLANAQFTIVPKLPDGSPVPGHENGESKTGLPGETIHLTPIPGYTTTITDVDVPTDDPNVVVTYTADPQKATIHFVDQSGQTVATDLVIEGSSDLTLARTDVNAAIQAVLNKNYNLVSNPTATNNFDHDDNVDQNFTVVFSKLPDANFTVVPKTPDGSNVPGYPGGVSETGQPGDPISVPSVEGYTPTGTVPDVPTNGGSVVVTYKPDVQHGTVLFVDQDGKQLAIVQVTGVSDGSIDRSQGVHAEIQTLLNQGYNLTSDETATAKFDHIDGADQTFIITMTKLPPEVTNSGTGSNTGTGTITAPTEPDENSSNPKVTGKTNNHQGRTTTSKGDDEAKTLTHENGSTSASSARTTAEYSSASKTAATMANSPQNGTQSRHQSQLPQTNEKQTVFAQIGLGLMSLLTLFGLLGKRRKKEDDK